MLTHVGQTLLCAAQQHYLEVAVERLSDCGGHCCGDRRLSLKPLAEANERCRDTGVKPEWRARCHECSRLGKGTASAVLEHSKVLGGRGRIAGRELPARSLGEQH